MPAHALSPAERVQRQRENKARYRQSPKGQQKAKEYYEGRKEQYLAANRARALKRAFGIDTSEYEAMLANQDGRCAICGVHHIACARRLAVDHNHKTGKIRGLLCFRCNASIGKFGDDPDLLEKAVSYLKEYDLA